MKRLVLVGKNAYVTECESQSICESMSWTQVVF